MKITLLEVPLKLFLKRLKTAYLNDNVVKLGSSVDVPILTFAVIPSKILCHSNDHPLERLLLLRVGILDTI